MDPNAGTVAELAGLRHINDAQRETARILRDTLAHYAASGDMNATQGLDRIVREQAFTVLNRLAALRMCASVCAAIRNHARYISSAPRLPRQNST